MIKKIISGGQTGADMGGLLAAENLGIKTGGTAPLGYRTENGSNLELKTRFGLEESFSRNYPPRTEHNVMISNGTIIFGDSNSPGCRLTIRLCKKHKKPYWVVTNEDFNRPLFLKFAQAWLIDNKVEILNIAGNRESTNKGIEIKVRNYLIDLLKDLK